MGERPISSRVKRWVVWIRRYHPELVVGGVIPTRRSAPKGIRLEYAASMASTDRELADASEAAFHNRRVIELAGEMERVCNLGVLGNVSETALAHLNQARIALGEFLAHLAKYRETRRGPLSVEFQSADRSQSGPHSSGHP